MSLVGRGLRPSESRDINGSDLPGYPYAEGSLSLSGVGVTTTSALRHGDVYACIRVIADAVATTPLHVYDRPSDGHRVRVTTGATALLIERPAPTVSQANLFAAIAAHLNLWGEAFVSKLRGANGTVQQLQLIHPACVSSIRLSKGEPLYTLTPGYGSSVSGTFPRSDILHIRGLTLDGIRGLSPIAQARDTLGVSIALEDAAARDFANGSYPGGLIEIPGAISEKALDRFRLGWNAMHRGAKNRGKVAFLEDGWKYQTVGMPAKDAQFVEQRKMSATQIARIFRVPPYMIGADAGSSMTYSNVESEGQAFLMHTIRPWLVFIEQALLGDLDLFTPGSTTYPEFLLDAFLRADTLSRYTAYEKAAWMTDNEKRRRENLDDIEGGDVLPSQKAAAPAPADAPAHPTPEAIA